MEEKAVNLASEDMNNLGSLANEKEGLKRGMKPRHMLMMSIGGTIGTGLFMASGEVLAKAGPLGAVLAYLVAGLAMYAVMLCLAELAVSMPIAGSFQTYATRLVSPAAGFTTGWLYWFNWLTVISADVVIAGELTTKLVAGGLGLSAIQWGFLYVLILVLMNLVSVKVYGEMEFWFAGIKVCAIIAFIVVGLGVAFGGVGSPEGTVGFSRLIPAEGIFPNGIPAVFMMGLLSVYSFQGTELVGVGAAECENPGQNMKRVIKGVAFRIITFYVLAIVVLGMVLPWDQAGVDESPFAKVFGIAGIPFARELMNFVVLTSALSAANSAIYACSRFVWSMARDGQAPKMLDKLNKGGVPSRAIFFTIIMSVILVVGGEWANSSASADPNGIGVKLYIWLVNSSGLVGCLIWIIIALCQWRFRNIYVGRGGDPNKLPFKTPWTPFLPILVMVINGALMLFTLLPEEGVAFTDGEGPLFIAIVSMTAMFYIGYSLFGRKAEWAE